MKLLYKYIYNFNVYFGFYCRQTNNFSNDNNILKKNRLLPLSSRLHYITPTFLLKFLRFPILGSNTNVTLFSIIIIIVYYFVNVIIVFSFFINIILLTIAINIIIIVYCFVPIAIIIIIKYI